MFDFAQGLCGHFSEEQWMKLLRFYSRCIWMLHLTRHVVVFVVLNAFSCKCRLFESVPCASHEHSRIQTVDNHITHTAAPCTLLSPIHSLWNVLMLVFVSLSLPSFLFLFTCIYLDFYSLHWFVSELCCVDQPVLFLCSFKVPSRNCFFIHSSQVGCWVMHLHSLFCGLTTQNAFFFFFSSLL